MDLRFCLWPLLTRLLQSLTTKDHYPYIQRFFCHPLCDFEPNYHWFMQCKGNNNGDPLNAYTLFGEYPLPLNFHCFWCSNSLWFSPLVLYHFHFLVVMYYKIFKQVHLGNEQTQLFLPRNILLLSSICVRFSLCVHCKLLSLFNAIDIILNSVMYISKISFLH
jgi:hypothetical protein